MPSIKRWAPTSRRHGKQGVLFTLWAQKLGLSPSSRRAPVGEDAGQMNRTENGVWELFLPAAAAGDVYRYVITARTASSAINPYPYAFFAEKRPASGSVVCPWQAMTGRMRHTWPPRTIKRAGKAHGDL
jgi:1,4-alpha-glucan branching enzyme